MAELCWIPHAIVNWKKKWSAPLLKTNFTLALQFQPKAFEVPKTFIVFRFQQIYNKKIALEAVERHILILNIDQKPCSIKMRNTMNANKKKIGRKREKRWRGREEMIDDTVNIPKWNAILCRYMRKSFMFYNQMDRNTCIHFVSPPSVCRTSFFVPQQQSAIDYWYT